MYKNLISPEIRISIGNYILEEGLSFECVSSKESHSDWCKIILDDELKEYVNICDFDNASVELGYDDDFDTLISGFVRSGADAYWKEIMIKDEMLLIERLKIKATFLGCTAQDVVKYVLSAAGIENYVLSKESYGVRDSFVVDSKNGTDVLKTINSYWGISADYFFFRGTFYWGCKPEQEDVYVLNEYDNILDLDMQGTLWCAETIGIPWIHHSEIVEIEHEKYTGYGMVEKVVIRSNEKGYVRQSIYFRAVEMGDEDV